MRVDKIIAAAKITLGVIDILIGLILLTSLVLLQGISFPFLMGILYLIFGFNAVFAKFPKLKLLFYGILPLTLLSSFMVIMMGTGDVPDYYRIPIVGQIITIAIFFIFCFSNIYFFTHRRIKESLNKVRQNV